jgi:hypothetical protein
MPILYGAVAYREDQIPRFETEIGTWELSRVYEHPIACPYGGACDKIYRLHVEVNAADETAKEYVFLILDRMGKERCDRHPYFIRIGA